MPTADRSPARRRLAAVLLILPAALLAPLALTGCSEDRGGQTVEPAEPEPESPAM